MNTLRILAALRAARPGFRAGLPAHIARMTDLARQRRALNALDDHLLEDIGRTRVEALEEAQRRIWDVPDNWRR